MKTRELMFFAVVFSLFATTRCAALPDTDALIERHTGQAARF